jgi:hypothetical protein
MKRSLVIGSCLLLLMGYCAFAALPRVTVSTLPMSISYNVSVNAGVPDLGATISYLQYDPTTRSGIAGTGGPSTYFADGRTTLRLAAGKNWRVCVYLTNSRFGSIEVPTAFVDLPNLSSAKTIRLEWTGRNAAF